MPAITCQTVCLSISMFTRQVFTGQFILVPILLMWPTDHAKKILLKYRFCSDNWKIFLNAVGCHQILLNGHYLRQRGNSSYRICVLWIYTVAFCSHMPSIYRESLHFITGTFFLHNVLRTVLIERFTSVLTLVLPRTKFFYTKMHTPS